MGAAPTFADRIRRRGQLWWDPPRPGSGRGVRDAVHRLSERRAFRSREDPESDWRCCERWPRTLVNKWNGREYAARHGCVLPALIWRGTDHDEFLDSRPDEFAMRPVFGAGRMGVAVVADGRDLIYDRPMGDAELRERIPRSGPLRRPAAMVVEERVPRIGDPMRLPIEVKAMSFAGHVAGFQRLDRIPRGYGRNSRQRYYLPDWTPLEDPVNTHELDLDEPAPPPPGLDEMIAAAERIGRAVGTFIRVDYFEAEGGPIFNEFSTTPDLGQGYTPFGDRLFGDAWQEHCPDQV